MADSEVLYCTIWEPEDGRNALSGGGTTWNPLAKKKRWYGNGTGWGGKLLGSVTLLTARVGISSNCTPVSSGLITQTIITETYVEDDTPAITCGTASFRGQATGRVSG